MTLTRADFRAALRRELQDETLGAYLWSDELLNGYLEDALLRYDDDYPAEATATLATVAGQTDYALPADCATLLRVEYPAGVFLPRDPNVSGDAVSPLYPAPGVVPADEHAAGGQAWDVWDSQLVLRYPPTEAGQEMALRYHARRPLPGADDDATATPAQDDRLILYLAAAAALRWLQGARDKRGAPARPSPRAYADLYLAALQRRRRRLVSRRAVSGV